jgi:PIN domain nuclease of toxin-antitoxin system
MRILLDTHILLWLVTDSALLSDKVLEIVGNPENICFFSPVSIYEISHKHWKHPPQMSFNGCEARAVFVDAGFVELQLTSRQMAEADTLEMHHNDPFDRMLLAQAKSEGMMLLSHDRRFSPYGEFVMAV